MELRPDIPKLVELDETGSTNDHACQLALHGAKEGTVVWAHRQIAGKGRQGNTWTSFEGNLYMSLILCPGRPVQEIGQLSFVAALALVETIRSFLPAQVDIGLKWPNDLLLNGKKAAGILLETEAAAGDSPQAVIIGIGVNIKAAPEGANSLASLGVETTSAALLEKLYKNLMSLYRLWLDTGFDPIRKEWLRYAHNIGNMISVRLPRETFTAKFIGIAHDGALQVEMPDGMRRDIASGEVFAL